MGKFTNFLSDPSDATKGVTALHEVPLESASTGKRAARYPFVARVKAKDVDSGMQIHGLTTDLSEGGCGVATRWAPFSPGTRILLEITKNGVLLRTDATVVYNLKDQVMGLCFVEMPPDQTAVLAGWIKAASRLSVPQPPLADSCRRGTPQTRNHS